MRKKALLYGGILLIIVAFAGLFLGYNLVETAVNGEGPSEKQLWISFSLQLLAGICFIWQYIVQSKHHQKKAD